MTTVLLLFIAAFILSLFLTPLAGKAGTRFGALDFPGERKIHQVPVPRTGGAAIFVSFLVVLVIARLFETKVTALFVLDRQRLFLFAGALVCFGVGLFDDFHRLNSKVKLIFQLLAASIAFAGGIRIDEFIMPGASIYFGFLAYPVTLLWFVLFINAVNLIDGMDGLAGGVVFFTSAVMVFIAIMSGNFLLAGSFGALAGSVIGFLRYNFHPARIFLGDGGSYFLGYMIAGLSILGAFKSPISFLLLIPLLALGVPIFDTILSPVRRFFTGRKAFSADDDHVHHRLLKRGFTAGKALILIYVITFCLCITAIVLVNIRDERAGLFLVLLGAGAIVFFKRLGYSDILGKGSMADWVEDFSDDIFLSRDRRNFVAYQSEIVKSTNVSELWENVIPVLEALRFDKVSLYLNPSAKKNEPHDLEEKTSVKAPVERRSVSLIDSSVIMRKFPPDLKWIRFPLQMEDYVCSRAIFRLEIPLLIKDNYHFGTLVLVKDTNKEPVDQQLLRRVSGLRRSITRALEQISANPESGKMLGEIDRKTFSSDQKMKTKTY